jgi:predicted MarR family transcription regulator
MIRCSDDASQLVRICCSDRIADYAVRFLQAGDHIRAIGTMKERTWTTARGERASALRLFVDDLSAIREPA